MLDPQVSGIRDQQALLSTCCGSNTALGALGVCRVLEGQPPSLLQPPCSLPRGGVPEHTLLVTAGHKRSSHQPVWNLAHYTKQTSLCLTLAASLSSCLVFAWHTSRAQSLWARLGGTSPAAAFPVLMRERRASEGMVPLGDVYDVCAQNDQALQPSSEDRPFTSPRGLSAAPSRAVSLVPGAHLPPPLPHPLCVSPDPTPPTPAPGPHPLTSRARLWPGNKNVPSSHHSEQASASSMDVKSWQSGCGGEMGGRAEVEAVLSQGLALDRSSLHPHLHFIDGEMRSWKD